MELTPVLMRANLMQLGHHRSHHHPCMVQALPLSPTEAVAKQQHAVSEPGTSISTALNIARVACCLPARKEDYRPWARTLQSLVNIPG